MTDVENNQFNPFGFGTSLFGSVVLVQVKVTLDDLRKWQRLI